MTGLKNRPCHYCFENLLRAEQLVGGVDRSRLEMDPAQVLDSILGIQQQLILDKTSLWLESGDAGQKARAALAKVLIETSQPTDSIRAAGTRILYPAEYSTRADALIDARRLVDGVLIEKDAEQM